MMETMKKWLPSKRKFMQLYFALLFNVNLKGFSTGNIYQGSSKQFCVPGINCYSCPGAIGACPLGSLQGAFSAEHSTIWYVGGILLLYSILFGRMICGWLCPFGFVQELLHKIPTPKIKKGPVSRILSYLKYVILVFFVFVVPLLYAARDIPLPAFCKYICPAGTLEGGIGLLSNKVNSSYFSMLGPLFTWKFLLMVSILLGTIFVFRLFCRFICPLGALYGLFNRFSVFGIKLDKSKCIDCGKCIHHCKVDIHHVGDQECISCGSCIDVCPTKAIHWKGPKILLRANETGTAPSKGQNTLRLVIRCVSLLLMLTVLISAGVYYWNQSSQVTADLGTEVGNLCYGYDLTVVDASGETEQTINPPETGMVTIINFWGTWCTPCVNELPFFEQIAEEYPQVSVIAIHSAVSRETAPAYIETHYPDSPIIFAWDDGEGFTGAYYSSLGGRGTYPYTIVLDENGIITHIFYSSVTYEDLKSAVDP